MEIKVNIDDSIYCKVKQHSALCSLTISQYINEVLKQEIG